MRTFLIFTAIFFVTSFSNAQTSTLPFWKEGAKIPDETKNILVEFPHFDLKINDNYTFGISNPDFPSAKQAEERAQILAAIYHHPKFELVADFFEKVLEDRNSFSTGQTQKELMRLFITEEPILKLDSSKILASGELLNTYKIIGWQTRTIAVEIDYFLQHYETVDGLSNSTKTILKTNNPYTIIQNGAFKNIYRNDSLLECSNSLITYELETKNISVYGGLWAFVINNHLSKAMVKVMEQSQNLQRTGDFYQNEIREINRHVGEGKLLLPYSSLDVFGNYPVHHLVRFFELGPNQTQKITYSKSGIKIESVHFKDGLLHGPYELWDEKGAPKIKSNYLDGKLHGKYEAFHENYKHRVWANYKNGKLDGNYIEYHDNGLITYKGVFKDGAPIGKHFIYYPDGQVKEKIKYKKTHDKAWHKFYLVNGKRIKILRF